MALILFDTNIFIDMLGGCSQATAELNAYVTAARWGLAVVTRNPRDFAALSIPVHVPYTYDSTSGAVSNVRKPYAATSRFKRLK